MTIATPEAAREVQRTYLVLTLLTTLAASFIWGINTLFLLSAGLDNTQAFAANAFFTVGQVLFEVPTGVVADTRGRRFSFLLGAATLLVATLLYLVMWQIRAPLWGWAIASILLGLGFTFFSGATEAWLVDALRATQFSGTLESVFARAQVVAGAAMLTGSVLGGLVAQATNLGVPYLLRAGMLGVTLLVALRFMHDIGFEPARGVRVGAAVRGGLKGSIDGGFRNPPVRWLMLAAPFVSGVSFYAFYALQPYLLQLYGDPKAYGVAGLAAAATAARPRDRALGSDSERRGSHPSGRFRRLAIPLVRGVEAGVRRPSRTTRLPHGFDSAGTVRAGVRSPGPARVANEDVATEGERRQRRRHSLRPARGRGPDAEDSRRPARWHPGARGGWSRCGRSSCPRARFKRDDP